MKRILILWLCILCCMFPLSACSQPGKSVEDLVEMGLAQLGKPLGEAYQALGLPGNPEDAVVFPFLLAEDSVELHGKRLGVVLDPLLRRQGRPAGQAAVKAAFAELGGIKGPFKAGL